MDDIVAKTLDAAKSWTFLDGSTRTAVVLGSVAIGRGNYHAGWRWSVHVGPQMGKRSQAHVGYVLSGYMTVRAANGREKTVGPGEAFEVGAGHDAWVVGPQPCLALDFEHLK